MSDHPTDWDLYTGMLTYAYNTEVHSSTAFSPFDLVLSKPPHSLVTSSVPETGDTPTPTQYLYR